MIDLRNWAGNYQFSAVAMHRPRDSDELRRLVAAGRKLKVLGTRHSFNHIADSTDGQLISLEHFKRIDSVDESARTVTIDAGVRYGELCRDLDARGYALQNLASLPHISVAGACATATHGSGSRNGVLSTAVSSMQIVAADGSVHAISRQKDGDRFAGMVVNLGALGVVVRLTLDVVPTYLVAQDVYENVPFELLEQQFDQLISSAYSVSLFTDWSGPRINQVWFKRRAGDQSSFELPKALRAARHLHPIAALSSVHCTEQMGIAGPWHERLPHFRMDFTPSSGEELQSEYFVARQHALPALRAVDAIRDRIWPLLQISEIRFIAADDLWMSPCYRQDSIAIHFTWKKDWPGVRNVLPILEQQLARFDAKPHWAKLFAMGPQRLRSLCPKLGDFQRLMDGMDPAGKFRNAFVETYLSGSA